MNVTFPIFLSILYLVTYEIFTENKKWLNSPTITFDRPCIY